MHHANIIIKKGDCRDVVFAIFKKDLGFDVVGNPDFLFLKMDTFGINDARDLGVWVAGKPLVGDAKIALVVVRSITHESQNALLKSLEEPPIGTYIFFHLENLGGILPTFLSRVRILDFEKEKGNEHYSNSKKFLYSNIKDRLSLIRLLSKKEDKIDMKKLIEELEEVAYKEKPNYENLKSIIKAKIFVSVRGSSPKMLLEWLACVL